MGYFEKAMASCAFEVKRGGILGKKYDVSLLIYEKKIIGEAFDLFESSLHHSHFDLPYERINKVDIIVVEGKESVIVEYKSDSLIHSNFLKKVVLWGIGEPAKWATIIEDARQKRMNQLDEQKEKERKEREKRENEMLQREKQAEQYYQNCYSFHIQPETPVYTFSTGKNEIVALYVGQNKALNFLRINGYSQEENVGTIPFEKIHYYEKAGNVSYTTDIHGSYSSYGGSFTGGRYSKLAALVGGALFGFMGMTAGALLTYKPTQQTTNNTHITLESETIKIDDRNVILNYYSDIKRQYIDIELPSNIFNFLQTHLPEKKYGIVEELERKAVTHQSIEAIQSGAVLNHGSSRVIEKLSEQSNNTMDNFKMKVEKLKLMKEAGLLSEQEFDIEKKKLLNSI